MTKNYEIVDYHNGISSMNFVLKEHIYFFDTEDKEKILAASTKWNSKKQGKHRFTAYYTDEKLDKPVFLQRVIMDAMDQDESVYYANDDCFDLRKANLVKLKNASPTSEIKKTKCLKALETLTPLKIALVSKKESVQSATTTHSHEIVDITKSYVSGKVMLIDKNGNNTVLDSNISDSDIQKLITSFLPKYTI